MNEVKLMSNFEIGSLTAKGGFANEKKICEKFNNWNSDNEAKLWLKIMGYNLNKICSVEAIHIPTRIKKCDIKNYNLDEDYEDLMKFKKSDAQLRIYIKIGNITKIENLSLKKANKNADYNQIDKRTVDTYKKIWNFDDDISIALKLFTGEINPNDKKSVIGNIKPKDKRRLFMDELPEKLRIKIITFFSENRILVVSDIIKGRGGLAADWMLVTKFNTTNNTTDWILKDINEVMNYFGGGDIVISPKGSLYIGKITMQRKGGTPDPTKLQFKIRPCDLFNLKQ